MVQLGEARAIDARECGFFYQSRWNLPPGSAATTSRTEVGQSVEISAAFSVRAASVSISQGS